MHMLQVLILAVYSVFNSTQHSRIATGVERQLGGTASGVPGSLVNKSIGGTCLHSMHASLVHMVGSIPAGVNMATGL
jgi:hypothetical protein